MTASKATPIQSCAPVIPQCVGMIVGVYGIGYLIAASDPLRHWPIVLVGFLGKIFGPIGFLAAGLRGDLPWSWGVTILSNDLIWWESSCTVRSPRLVSRPNETRLARVRKNFPERNPVCRGSKGRPKDPSRASDSQMIQASHTASHGYHPIP
jgi:hypothetical protein